MKNKTEELMRLIASPTVFFFCLPQSCFSVYCSHPLNHSERYCSLQSSLPSLVNPINPHVLYRNHNTILIYMITLLAIFYVRNDSTLGCTFSNLLSLKKGSSLLEASSVLLMATAFLFCSSLFSSFSFCCLFFSSLSFLAF